jgi:rhodanese-related sulfurtransferase
MASSSRITVSQLARLIGTAEAPIVIDVCIDEDFDADPRLIPTAKRHPYGEIPALVPVLADLRVGIVCQKGLKLSQGAAALLRSEGIAAEYLEGGKFAWRDSGQPLVPAAKQPIRTALGHTPWVIRERPNVDCMACLWLIRRFLDRDARFLFVQASEVGRVAEKFDATPFDVEGFIWSHRGEFCTFDVMLEELALGTAALRRLATVVRGADTKGLELAPESAGLLAATLGLSHIYRDDLAQLEAGMALFDAFYRWARDAEQVQDLPLSSQGGAS